MSRETLVRLEIGNTEVSFTYMSGEVAKSHGIDSPYDTRFYRGKEAERLITDTSILPPLELQFVRELLASHKKLNPTSQLDMDVSVSVTLSA
jgi:hypothetical protein